MHDTMGRPNDPSITVGTNKATAFEFSCVATMPPLARGTKMFIDNARDLDKY